MSTTEEKFHLIMRSSLFRLDGAEIDLCETLSELCEAINDEPETNWSMGEGLEATLDSLLVGAYWSLAEWHGGQWSPEYATLCQIGRIFNPDRTSAPESDQDGPKWEAYDACNRYFEAKLATA